MSDEKRQARRKRRRAERLESGVVLIFVLAIIATLGVCVFLTVRLREVSIGIDSLLQQVADLSQTVQRQQEQLDSLWERVAELSVEDIPDTPKEDETIQPKPDEGTPVEQKPDTDAVEAVDPYEGKHKVYLTFDDGPSKYTPEILDILDWYEVKATFFVVGKESASAREYILDIVDRGHTLGMHSYSHVYSEIYASVESFAADFDKQQQYLYQLTGEPCMVYRFPGGSSNTVSSVPMSEFARYLDGRGVTFYDWNIVSGDGAVELLTVEELVQNCTTGIGRDESSIILLHDSADKSTTVEALPEILESILSMENIVILPIEADTVPIQHIQWKVEETTE